MFYTYVLSCIAFEKNSKNKIYVGYCKNLKKRLSDHVNKSVETTKKFDCIKLIYYEACLNKTDALRREKQLKTGFGRGYIRRRLSYYFKSRD